MFLENRQGTKNSLQVSLVRDIPSGREFQCGWAFLVKNNTDDNIVITGVPVGQEDTVTTTMYPGWNPEIFSKIINPPRGLQYGY